MKNIEWFILGIIAGAVLVFLILLMIPNEIETTQPTTPKSEISPIKSRLKTIERGYNVVKDEYIQYVLTTKLISFEANEYDDAESFTLKYSDIIITVYHIKFVEFEQSESWYHKYTRRDGVVELIDPSNLSEENRISKKTIYKIRSVIDREKNKRTITFTTPKANVKFIQSTDTIAISQFNQTWEFSKKFDDSISLYSDSLDISFPVNYSDSVTFEYPIYIDTIIIE